MGKKSKNEINKEKKEQVNSKSSSQPNRSQHQLPILLETGLTIWWITVILIGSTTVLVSLINGCDFKTAMIRGGIAILVMGLLAWFTNWFIAQNSLKVVRLQVEEAIKELKSGKTIDKVA